MEKNNDELRRSSSHSWWSDISQWFYNTLSELDKMIRMILDVIEDDDGATFAKRAEMYYGKRPQLIKMVEELQRLYRALAIKYDELMFKSQASHEENKLLDSSQNLLHYPSTNPASESKNSIFEFGSSSSNLSPNSSKNPSNFKGSDHVHSISDKKNTSDGFPEDSNQQVTQGELDSQKFEVDAQNEAESKTEGMLPLPMKLGNRLLYLIDDSGGAATVADSSPLDVDSYGSSYPRGKMLGTLASLISAGSYLNLLQKSSSMELKGTGFLSIMVDCNANLVPEHLIPELAS
ncbi:NETWORKED 3A-like [Olea europaea subsp. europaea]|uniref:NETWORKED 3A-like n=1 Tax=Olea europaea subsp. europaea TaxID=158383 RepID=A0A8S0SIC8_OLEEU|nr:NETWORKED 3A-like [Olea europaea subsp. europaea]